MDSSQVNDPLTHLFRLGLVQRAGINERLTALAELLPKNFLGVPVEYDLTYESPVGTIRGYKYTDLLTSCLWIAPCNSTILLAYLKRLLAEEATPEGRKLCELVRESLTDKYVLESTDVEAEMLVVLPGSNVLDKGLLDLSHLKELAEKGAKFKLHPLTRRGWATKLAWLCGEDSIISKFDAMYPILRKVKVVYYPPNSEAGMSAALMGKEVHQLRTLPCPQPGTYQVLYEAIDFHPGLGVAEGIARLLSRPESGFMSVFHQEVYDMEQWVNKFFFHWQNHPHGRGKDNFISAVDVLKGSGFEVGQ